MLIPKKTIYSPIITVIALLTVALTLFTTQFVIVTLLSRSIMRTTKSQYLISDGSAALNKVFIGLLDIETATRGFALTNDRQYLDTYFGAKTIIDTSLVKMTESLMTNTEWSTQLQQLIPLIKEKIEYSDAMVRIREASELESLTTLSPDFRGKVTMDKIRSRYRQLDASLRSTRENIATINRQNQLYIVWIQTAIGSIVVALIAIATLFGVRSLKNYKLLNATLEIESTTDALTHLPNRRLFLIWAGLLLAKANRNESDLAMLFIDLNSFKNINDTLGHQTGDEVLQTIATRLQSMMRSSDFLARLGGDEFAILVSGRVTKQGLTVLKQHVFEAISAPFATGVLVTTRITASIGCSIYPQDGMTIEALMRDADQRMYDNKSAHETAHAPILS